MTDMATETTPIEPLPASGPAEAAEQIRAGERVTDRYAEAEQVLEEGQLEPQVVEAQPAAPEHSDEYQAGFEAALEQLTEYDRFESEIRQREELYEQLGEQVGMPAAQVQQILEDQARQEVMAQQQQQVAQQVTAAEMQQRMASLHHERTEILGSALTHLETEVGEFDHDEALAEAQRLAQEHPELDPRSLLRTAAETSAAQIAEGNARIEEAIARVNRYMGADPEAVRLAAERAFDPSAPDQGAAVAEAIRAGFQKAGSPVRFGQRVTDAYAEMNQVHRELASPTPPPQPLRVQLQSTEMVRDELGRFVGRPERVTDRYAREAAETDQEQQRLAAHQKLMRSKGLL
jgi:hypothetical protein